MIENLKGTHWEHDGNTPQKISPSFPFCLDSCYALSLSVKFLVLKLFVTIFDLCLYPFIRRWVPIRVAIQLLFHLPHFGSGVYIKNCFQLAKPSICDYTSYSLWLKKKKKPLHASKKLSNSRMVWSHSL